MWWRCACALTLLCAARADGALTHHKRADFSAVPFVLGSRYGRAPPPPPSPSRHLAPRNDRFFLGSRYGKRSASDDHTDVFADRQEALEALGGRTDAFTGRQEALEALSGRQEAFESPIDHSRAFADRQEASTTLTDHPRAVSDREGVSTMLADHPGAFTDRQIALLLSHQSPPTHRHSPSLLWQAVSLLTGRSHRTFDTDPS